MSVKILQTIQHAQSRCNLVGGLNRSKINN